MAMIKV